MPDPLKVVRQRARPPGELERLVEDPGFSPSVRDASALVRLAGDGVSAEAAARALARLGDDGARALAASIAEHLDDPSEPRPGAAEPAAVARLLALVKLAPALSGVLEAELLGALVRALSHASEPVRRGAARALGRAPAQHAGVAASALARALDREPEAPSIKALAEALGKLGEASAEDALAALLSASERTRDDAAVHPFVDRALRLVRRDVERDVSPALAFDAELARPARALLRCRDGLEEVLAHELRGSGLELSLRPGRVRTSPARTLAPLVSARTALTLSLLFEADVRRLPDDEAVDLVLGEVAPVLRSLSPTGPVRYRLTLVGRGKARAAVRELAERIEAAVPWLRNDPRESPVSLSVALHADRVRVEVTPRLPERFSYRRAEVAAASHPTLAAALALLGGARPDDVVWDPFVGSGLELCERALLGPFRELVGTDVDPRALAAARENLRQLGCDAALVSADARAGPPGGRRPTLVLTNPPFGVRVERNTGFRAMLHEAFARIAASLAPLGRLVWLSPLPSETRELARRAGLTLRAARTVDLGGLPAELQCFQARGARRAADDGWWASHLDGIVPDPSTIPSKIHH
jgi:hypothetical protein